MQNWDLYAVQPCGCCELSKDPCPIPRIFAHWNAGTVTGLDRKRELYAICCQYDVLIIEDDPYYYLQFSPSGEPIGMDALGTSYLSMDTDHRVIRLDSFAKVR